MSARTQAGAQNNQQDESPFRKFISLAQVRIYSRSALKTALSLPHLKQILLVYAVTQFGSPLDYIYFWLELT